MGGSRRQQPVGALNPPPLSPTSKATAKYTNKDGSKYITVPKGTTSTDSSQPSPTTVPAATAKSSASAAGPVGGSGANGRTQPVNRKKQKRREKAAAKAAAGQAPSGNPPAGLPSPPASQAPHSGEAEADSQDDDEHDADEDHRGSHPQPNGHATGSASKGKKSKKKKKKGAATGAEGSQDQGRSSAPAPSGMSRERIWNNSSQEERERIKEFWLGLSEKERKSLVKVEKDAVLKKMKEQQKHTCSCTVCGRKRTAIEEELEGLYDAYYEELEQYANHPSQGDPSSTFSPARCHPPSRPSAYSNHQPSRGHIVEHAGDDDDDDDDGEEEYSDELEEDEDYSEEEPSEDAYRRDQVRDQFFSFGNSLTVQGGILTVADDLLKNDGKKFIEMMEQLAERRMAREEDARTEYAPREYAHADGNDYGHHASPQDGVYDDEEDEYEEDEEEYDSQEDEDPMTEEQRMEEGRRMFQIFAARMFEQRVLTAYREKVAKERQEKLLEELDDEKLKEERRAEKKAREAQKRKEKVAKKKEREAEEKARKEASKAAEEEAQRAEEQRKLEEQRRKTEEKKRLREAQKKQEEEERQRKDAERLRRAQEREEKEQKAREAKEKQREEARQREKDLKEQKERQARERKDQQERDKREKEAKAKAAKEAKDAAREAREKEKEKLKQEERAAQKAAALSAAIPVPITLPKRPAQHQAPAAVPAVPHQPAGSYASPQISVATPALPKAPTPMRVRQSSQHESTTGPSSQSGSGPSQNPSPHPITPIHASPGPIGPPGKVVAIPAGTPVPSHPASPPSTAAKPPFGHSGSFVVPPPIGSYPPGLPPPIPQAMSTQIPPGFGSPIAHDNIFGTALPHPYRPPTNLGPTPPGFGGPVAGRGLPVYPPPGFSGSLDPAVAGLSQVFGSPIAKEPAQTHSRQGSGSFEPGTPASQPISRPAPIARPSSIVHGQRPPSDSPGTGISNRVETDSHLGSSALLDDFEDTNSFSDHPQRNLGGAGMFPSTLGARPPAAFPMSGFGNMESFLPPASLSNMWAPLNGPPQANIFSPQPPPGFGTAPLNTPWGLQPAASAFGGPGMMDRPSEPRYVTIRKMLCRVCHNLSSKDRGQSLGFSTLNDVRAELNKSNLEVEEKELLEVCETEGNHQNGGGTFELRDHPLGMMIRWEPTTDHRPVQRAVGAPGEFSSPVAGAGYR